MITVTETAKKQLDEILMDEPNGKYVRAFISGGGCSGFNYGFTIEENKEEDDFVIDNLVVDAMSMQYFEKATIDFTSGCGSSFSV